MHLAVCLPNRFASSIIMLRRKILPKDSENISFFDELPQPTEPLGFSHQQMVRCDDCLRANPPTRVTCLYCGYALPQTEASVALAKPTLRPLEASCG
jgi:hypothetical protein